MKKIIFILIAIFIPVAANSQWHTGKQRYRAVVSGTFHPQDKGVGAKCEYRPGGKLGYYVSGSYGNYDGYDSRLRRYRVADHIEVSAGITIPEHRSSARLIVGVSYHNYGDMIITDEINTGAFRHISAEFGASSNIGRLNGGFRFDPIKWEGNIDIGYNFIKY